MTAIPQVTKNSDDDWLSEDYFLDADTSKSWSESISTSGLIQKALTHIRYYEDDTDNSWMSVNSTHATLMTTQYSSPALAVGFLEEGGDSDAVVSEMTRASNSRSSSAERSSGQTSSSGNRSSRKSKGERKTQSFLRERSSSAEAKRKIEKKSESSPSNKRKRKENARKGTKKKRKRKDGAMGSGSSCNKKTTPCNGRAAAAEILSCSSVKKAIPDSCTCLDVNDEQYCDTEKRVTQCACRDRKSYDERNQESCQVMSETADVCACEGGESTVEQLLQQASLERSNKRCQVFTPDPETRDACEQTCENRKDIMNTEEGFRRYYSYVQGKYALYSHPPRCPRSRHRSSSRKDRNRVSRENSIVREYFYDNARQAWTLSSDRTDISGQYPYPLPVLSYPNDGQNTCMSIPAEATTPVQPYIRPHFVSPAYQVQSTMDDQCPAHPASSSRDAVSYNPIVSLSPVTISLCDCTGETNTQHLGSGGNPFQSDQNNILATGSGSDPYGGKRVLLTCSCTSADAAPRVLQSPADETIMVEEELSCSQINQTFFDCSTMTEDIASRKKDVGSTACVCSEAQTQTVCETGTCTTSDIIPRILDKETLVSRTCEAGTTVSTEVLGPCSLQNSIREIVKCERCTSMSSEKLCSNASEKNNPQCKVKWHMPKPASESCVGTTSSAIERQRNTCRTSDSGMAKQKLVPITMELCKSSQKCANVRDTSTSPLPNQKLLCDRSQPMSEYNATLKISTTNEGCDSNKNCKMSNASPPNNAVCSTNTKRSGLTTCGGKFLNKECPIPSQEDLRVSEDMSQLCDCLTDGYDESTAACCTAQSTEALANSSVQLAECGLEHDVDDFRNSTSTCSEICAKPEEQVLADEDDACNCSGSSGTLTVNATPNIPVCTSNNTETNLGEQCECSSEEGGTNLQYCAATSDISKKTETKTECSSKIMNQRDCVSVQKIRDCTSNNKGRTYISQKSDIKCKCAPVPKVNTKTQTEPRPFQILVPQDDCGRKKLKTNNNCDTINSQSSTADLRRVNKRPWRSPCSSEVIKEVPGLSCKPIDVSPLDQNQVVCTPQSQKKKKSRSRSRASKTSSTSEVSCKGTFRSIPIIPKRNRSEYRGTIEGSKTWIGHRICSKRKGKTNVGPRSSSTPGTCDRGTAKVLGISMSQRYQSCVSNISGCSKRQDMNKTGSIVSFCGWKSKQTMAICKGGFICALSRKERKEMCTSNSFISTSMNKEANISCGDVRRTRTLETVNTCSETRSQEVSSCKKEEANVCENNNSVSAVCETCGEPPEQDSNACTCEAPIENCDNKNYDTKCSGNEEEARYMVDDNNTPACSPEDRNSVTCEDSRRLPSCVNEIGDTSNCSQPVTGSTNNYIEECTCDDAPKEEQCANPSDSYSAEPQNETQDTSQNQQLDDLCNCGTDDTCQNQQPDDLCNCDQDDQTKTNISSPDAYTSAGDPTSAKSCTSEVPDTYTCNCSADESSTENPSFCPSSVQRTAPCTTDDDVDTYIRTANECLRESKRKSNKFSGNKPQRSTKDRRSRSKSRKYACEIDDEKTLSKRLHNLRIHSSTNVIEYPPCGGPRIKVYAKDCTQSITENPCKIVTPTNIAHPPCEASEEYRLNVCSLTQPVPPCTSVSSGARIMGSTTPNASNGQPVFGQVKGTMLGDGTIVIDYDSLCAAVAGQPAVQQMAGFTRNQDMHNTCHGANSLPTILETSTDCMQRNTSITCDRNQPQETPSCCSHPVTPDSSQSTCTCWLKLEVFQSAPTNNLTPPCNPQPFSTCQISTPPISEPCGTPVNVTGSCISQTSPARILISQPNTSTACSLNSHSRTCGSVTQQNISSGSTVCGVITNTTCQPHQNQTLPHGQVVFSSLPNPTIHCPPIESQNTPTYVIEYLPKPSRTVCSEGVDTVPCRLVHSIPTACDSSPCGAAPSPGAPCGPNPSCENPNACRCNLTCASRRVPEIRIIRDNSSSGVACALDWPCPKRGDFWETETSCNYRPHCLRRSESVHAGHCLPTRDCGSTVTWDTIANARCASARKATAAATVACDSATYGTPTYLKQATLYRIAPSTVQPCRNVIRQPSQIFYSTPPCPRKTISHPVSSCQTWEYAPSYRSVADSCSTSEPEFIHFFREVKIPAPGDSCQTTLYRCPTIASSAHPPCRMRSTPSCSEEDFDWLPRSRTPVSRRASSHPFFAGNTGPSFNMLAGKSNRHSAGSYRQSFTLRKTVETRALRITHDVSKDRAHSAASAGDAQHSARAVIRSSTLSRKHSLKRWLREIQQPFNLETSDPTAKRRTNTKTKHRYRVVPALLPRGNPV